MHELKYTEQQIQARCFQWYWNDFPEERGMLFHIDNNSANQVVGNQKKALGVVRGISDFILILPDGRIVFIELKKPGGMQSVYQKQFSDKLTQRRLHYFVIYSFEEFKDLIEQLWQNIGN